MRPSTLLRLVFVLLAGALAEPLAAQAATRARIEGSVFDSITAKPRAGAIVTIVRVSPEPMQFISVLTDSTGRFLADSLSAGRYTVEFNTPFLDSLEVQVPARELTLVDGAREALAFATPSRSSLSAVACPGIALPKGRGAVVGSVADADADRPLPGATVAFTWSELSFDMAARRAVSLPQTGAVVTDSLGRFRICGVPTDTYLVLQVQREGRAGTAIRAMVPDDGGVYLQRLSVSATATRTLAAADSADTDTATVLLRGTAILAGTVRGPDGRPLDNVQLRVADAVGSARTDSTGAFTLAGLPAGTQLLEARRVGYLIGRLPVELRSGTTATADVRMSRIVTLDSVRVLATRGSARLRDFESRTGASRTAGSVFRASDIEKIRPIQTSDIMRRALGFKVIGDGLEARVESTRGLVSLTQRCEVNVVIDGMQRQDINLVQPSDIAGIEVYRGPAGAPGIYDSACGLIVIWTK